MALYQNGILISGRHDLPAMDYDVWDALPAAQKPQEWVCTDRNYTQIPRESVSVTADGVKTISKLLDELYALVDWSLVKPWSILELHQTAYQFVLPSNSEYYFSALFVHTGGAEGTTCRVRSNNSTRISGVGSSYVDESSSVFQSGRLITLYY